jgi:hypothetical protein
MGEVVGATGDNQVIEASVRGNGGVNSTDARIGILSGVYNFASFRVVADRPGAGGAVHE